MVVNTGSKNKIQLTPKYIHKVRHVKLIHLHYTCIIHVPELIYHVTFTYISREYICKHKWIHVHTSMWGLQNACITLLKSHILVHWYTFKSSSNNHSFLVTDTHPSGL